MIEKGQDDVDPNDSGYYSRVDDYAADAKALSTADFAKKHGSAFLLHHGPLGALKAPVGAQATVMITAKDPDDDSPEAQRDFLVFPVRRSGRSPFPNFISVGRTKNNDVVIADVSLSKFHAFFKVGESLALQDAGSKNGTYINEERIPTQQEGAPVPAETGAMLRFGTVDVTLLDAESFANLVRMLVP